MSGNDWGRNRDGNWRSENTVHDPARPDVVSQHEDEPQWQHPGRRTALIAALTTLIVIIVAGGVFGASRASWFADASRAASLTTATPGLAPTAIPSSTSAPDRAPTPTPTHASTQHTDASSYNVQQLIPVGGTLPSDAFCASVALAQGDSREAIAANTTPNHDNVHHTGVWNGNDPAQSDMGRVDGSVSGTTDQILVWAACKWGFPADSVRAQAVAESSWKQSQLGDCGVTTQTETNGCSSVGILQVKGADIPPTHPNTWPYAYESTAWNVDYTLSVRRACFDGKITWLGNGYTAGNMWGCVGEWFAGAWLTAGANDYIASVQQHEANRDWLTYYS